MSRVTAENNRRVEASRLLSESLDWETTLKAVARLAVRALCDYCMVDVLGEERGLKLFRDIVAVNGISVRKGHTLLANLVISGEVPLALSTYVYKVAQLKGRGAPKDWITIPPGMARFEGAGIARRAPHPYAAMLYLDFMLTDAQDILAKRDFYPSSLKVKPMPADMALTFLDPAKALDQSQKWSKYYRDIVTHPAR